jgi:hypothetical protein
MKMLLTIARAMDIQERRIAAYSSSYPGGEVALRAHLEYLTDVHGLDPDDLVDIFEANRRIPRGGAIEAVLSAARMGVCWIPENSQL